MKTSFLLTKWYLDCVAENGDTAILYLANLRWNTVSIAYGSVLTFLDGKMGSSASLYDNAAPKVGPKTIAFTHPRLGVEGTWTALRPPAYRTVVQNADGSVHWNCMQPMSQVDLLLPGNLRTAGLGYVECLTVTILPWQLPLTSLNWGRYLSQQDAVVWVDWQGADGRRCVLHNGEEQDADSITQAEVVFSGGRLDLDCGLVLRQGLLADTVFPEISRLAALLPHSILSANMCTWRSRGRFRATTGESSGWAIHEVVKWND